MKLSLLHNEVTSLTCIDMTADSYFNQVHHGASLCLWSSVLLKLLAT